MVNAVLRENTVFEIHLPKSHFLSGSSTLNFRLDKNQHKKKYPRLFWTRNIQKLGKWDTFAIFTHCEQKEGRGIYGQT